MSQEQENLEGYADSIDKNQEERKTTVDEKMDAESGGDAHLGLLDQPLVVEGKRKRKSVQSFQSPDSTPSKKKKVEVEEGSGVKLGDITLVDAALNKKKTDELRPLYKLLFDQQGTRMEMKKNIRAFSGFPFSEGSDDYKRRLMSLERLQKPALSTHYCQSLGLSVAGNKKELISRIMKFLLKPEGDKPMPSRTMAGRKASKGRRGGKQASGKEGIAQEEKGEKMDDESVDKQGSNTTQGVEDKGGDQQVSEGGDQQVSEGGDQQVSEGGDQQVSEGGDQQVSESGDQQVSESGDQQVSEGGDQQVSEFSLSADEGKKRDTASFEPSDISVGRSTTPTDTGCKSQEGRTDETANREVASQKSVILEQTHHKQVVIAEQ